MTYVTPQSKRLHPAGLCRRFGAGAGMVALIAVYGAAQTSDRIPDAGALLKEVLEHQQKTDAIRENYTFHEIVRTDTLDGSGVVRETKSQESEVFFVNGHR